MSRARSALACIFLGLIGTLVPTQEARADATLSVRLPQAPTRPKSISVVAIAAETREVLASVSTNGASAQTTLTVKPVPQVVFAEMLLQDGTAVTGHSHVLRPVDGRTMTVDLTATRAAAVAPVIVNAAYRRFVSFSAAAAAGPTPIGLPSNGFTVKGLDLSSKAVAHVVITELIRGSRCYNEDGGFVVVETDPDVLAIMKAEIDLSNSRFGDPSTRLTNRYVPPGRSVTGSLSSDGTNVTVTLRVVDSQNRELLNKSATGPLNRYLDINADVASALAAAMSCSPKPGYHTDGPFGDGGRVFGTICSGLDKPFTLNFDSPVGLVGTFKFNPSSQTAGAWTYSGHFQDMVTNTANGTYTLAGVQNGKERVRIEIPAGAKWVQTTMLVGSVTHVAPKATIVLEPLPNGCPK